MAYIFDEFLDSLTVFMIHYFLLVFNGRQSLIQNQVKHLK